MKPPDGSDAVLLPREDSGDDTALDGTMHHRSLVRRPGARYLSQAATQDIEDCRADQQTKQRAMVRRQARGDLDVPVHFDDASLVSDNVWTLPMGGLSHGSHAFRLGPITHADSLYLIKGRQLYSRGLQQRA
jgi:hypothetical protein